jgi:hypothetical protein
MTQPIGCGRATEDYLDWLENHRRIERRRGRRAAGWIGFAVAITTAAVAVVVRFAGF